MTIEKEITEPPFKLVAKRQFSWKIVFEEIDSEGFIQTTCLGSSIDFAIKTVRSNFGRDIFIHSVELIKSEG